MAAPKPRRAVKANPEQTTRRLLEILEQNLAHSTEPALKERLQRAIAVLSSEAAA